MRRWGLPGLAAAIGGLLLLSGIGAALVDAQLRSDAATAAVAFTAEEREKLEEARMYRSVVADAPFVRRSLILQNLSSGGRMPERYLEITETEDGSISMSWGARESRAFSVWGGGWQLKPVGILSFAGLSLMIAAGFAVAARYQKQHPPP